MAGSPGSPKLVAVAATTSTTIYPTGVVLAMFSLIMLLLMIPPLLWHFRQRNLGATFFIGWASYLLLSNFINPMIWDTDDISNWYNGVGLCDIEVKLQVASQVGVPAAFSCVLRALAAIMNINQTAMMKTKAQERRALTIDLIICIFFPLLQMPLHFIVQSNRYNIIGITGCQLTAADSWLSIVLVLLPTGLWLGLDGYYAVLIIVRLYLYRLKISSILASNHTTKARFLRLYLLCVTWLVVSTGVWVYELWRDCPILNKPFSWSKTHNPASWNTIILFPSYGHVFYDRWAWLLESVLIFVFFGFGKEGNDMYRAPLISLGLGKIFPCLKRDVNGNRPNGPATVKPPATGRILSVFKQKSRVPSTASSSSPTDLKDFAGTHSQVSSGNPQISSVITSSGSPSKFRFLSNVLPTRLTSAKSSQCLNDHQHADYPLGFEAKEASTVRSATSTNPLIDTPSEVVVSSTRELTISRAFTQGSQDAESDV